MIKLLETSLFILKTAFAAIKNSSGHVTIQTVVRLS